ncbi:MAG: hypothetical protein IOB84_13590 [Brevundimonas sp.]|nr:hypothetical protein [Brevundimonas sp.]
MTKMVMTWRGEPLESLSRDQLVQAIDDLASENQRLNDSLLRSQTRHIQDLAQMARRRAR